MNLYDKTVRDCTTVGRHFDAMDDQPSSRILLNALREPLREYVLKNKELRYDMAPFIPMYGYNVQKYVFSVKDITNLIQRMMVLTFREC